MLYDLIKTLILFKNFIIISVILTMILTVVLLFLTRGLKLNSKKIKWVGLFYMLPKSLILKLSLGYLRVVFVVVLLVSFTTIELAHYIFFLLLSILYLIIYPSIGGVLFEILNVILSCLALLVCEMLSTYILQVRFEWWVLITYILLASFVTLYSLYVFMCGVTTISKKRRDILAKNSI